jgi:hypothetical protein
MQTLLASLSAYLSRGCTGDLSDTPPPAPGVFPHRPP